ncbi:hypothetical protein IMG5_193860 [Ichthyophthirius multifiliis]|uniref:Leucine rich repeat protein n=1 Tax=Ichthyophthirius multifiliis TaxID=5932 RepID=G0R4M6_ICHMU|nr:hypothetical protein IMG5_193860 [Ichthyophthirius multifiliis]EGR27586.1 hypothetical protein IMG5_193860 [Ichthyophthirius multifiliis]|eukprot:XP_004025038.1 hypothetical protein IMG5_193860 [Ichthyophthirius multifiliis]
MESSLQFPELQCPEHKSQIILVSPDFQEGKRNFLCSRCVASSHTSMKELDKLVVYDDFVQHLNEQSGLNLRNSEDAEKLSIQRNENLKNFKNHLNNQNKQISELNDQLRASYEEKCKEMVKQLQSTLDIEYSVLQNHYEKFQNEIQADNEKEANIPKFKDIREQVNNVKGDLTQVEEYLSKIVKQKEQWNKASQDLRTLGQRTLHLNLEQSCVSIYVLDQLFSGLKDLENLTDLHINLQGCKIGDSFSVYLGHALGQLKNLHILYLNLSLNNLTKKSVDNIFHDFANLNQLQHLHFDGRYNDINDINALVNNLHLLEKTLTHLSVYLGGFSHIRNKVNADSLKLFVKQIRVLSKLHVLNLDMGFVGVEDDLVIELACVLKVLEDLRELKVQLYTNDLEGRSCAKIVKSCQKLHKLTNLEINFNNNEKIGIQGIRDIIRNLKYMEQLTDLSIFLRNVGAKREEVHKEKEDLEKNKCGNKFQTLNLYL